MGPVAAKRTVIVTLTATLSAGIVGFEGMEFSPYRDVGGVWTVCGGITGPHVIPGKSYSPRECVALTDGAIVRKGEAVRACIGDEHLTQPVYEAVTSLAFNVGEGAVCRGSIPKLLQAGDVAGACDRILAYDKVRIDGTLRSCAEPQWNCRGVWLRRQAEQRWCKGQPPSLGTQG